MIDVVLLRGEIKIECTSIVYKYLLPNSSKAGEVNRPPQIDAVQLHQ